MQKLQILNVIFMFFLIGKFFNLNMASYSLINRFYVLNKVIVLVIELLSGMAL